MLIGAIVILAVFLAIATTPGSIELLVLTIAGLLPPRPEGNQRHGQIQRLTVVIPAHNEEFNVARTVRSMLNCTTTSLSYSVVVIADNCDDATAVRATDSGARVIERTNLEQRGKGAALNFAFQILLNEPDSPDAFAVIDADSVVEPNFIEEMAGLIARGADAVQARYEVLNVDASIRTRLMTIALIAFNVLRPRGRDRLGVSVGIFGNGFALTADTLRAVPYEADSIVEDLEYHLRLVRAGRKVHFADRTTVRADTPTRSAAARSQRARWEGGRLRMIREYVPSLLREILSGRLRMLEPLAELLLLPLAYHVTLLLVLLLLPLDAFRCYALAGLAIVASHVVTAIFVGGRGWQDVAALAAAPAYIAWKLLLLPVVTHASGKTVEWKRTARTEPPQKVQ